MPTISEKDSKYFLYIAIAFVVILVIANTVAPKLFQLGPLVLSGAVVVFPISYIFGDILTEIYGYRASRKVVWSGLGAMVLMSLVYWFVQNLPPASFWQNQEAYEAILGVAPRIAVAGVIAFFAGEFSNSYVLSKMKVWMKGRHLWTRTIGSTVVGEGVDTLFFYTIAFAGLIPFAGLITLLWSSYLFKVAYEILATPFTYAIVNWLKRKEGIDVYDYGINYNPFVLKDK